MLVAAHVSPELDRLKHIYQGLPHHLTQVVEDELGRVPRALDGGLTGQSWSIHYIPQVPLRCSSFAGQPCLLRTARNA